jgi:NAD(P)-dependent dehydrogenase (short-subunit alcohol dehydrogenase family)
MRGGGSIIIMPLVAGIRGLVGQAGYCATKGSARLFAQAVAMECLAAERWHPGQHRPFRGHRHADLDGATGIGREQCADRPERVAKTGVSLGRAGQVQIYRERGSLPRL